MRFQAISLIETLTSSAISLMKQWDPLWKVGLDSSTTKLGGMNQQQLRGIYNKHMEYLPAIIPRIITILTNNTGTNQQSGEIKHQTLGLYQLVMDMFGFKQGFIYLDPSKTEMLASKQMGYMGIWIYIYNVYIYKHTYIYIYSYMCIYTYGNIGGGDLGADFAQ